MRLSGWRSLSRSVHGRRLAGLFSGLALVLASLAGLAPTAAADGACTQSPVASGCVTVSVSPSQSVLDGGAQESVNVMLDVTGPARITSWQLAVSFDPRVVSFAGCPAQTYSCGPAGSNPVDTVLLSGTTGGVGLNGVFQVGTISFQGAATGLTPLDVSVLGSSSPNAVLEFEAGGQVIGQYPGSAPQPMGSIAVPPSVTSLSVAQGPAAGGTSLYVDGSGFDGPTEDVTNAVYGAVYGSLGASVQQVLFGGVAGAMVGGAPLNGTTIEAISPAATAGMQTQPLGGDCLNGCTLDVQVAATMGSPTGRPPTATTSADSGTVPADRFTYTTGNSVGISLTPVSQTVDPGATGVQVQIQAVPPLPPGGLTSWDVKLQLDSPLTATACSVVGSVYDQVYGTVGLSQSCTGSPGSGPVELSGDTDAGALTGTSPITLATLTLTAGTGSTPQGTVAAVTPTLLNFNGPTADASATGATITIASVPVIAAATSGCAGIGPNPYPSNPYPDQGWPGGGLTNQLLYGGSLVCINGSGFNTAPSGVTVTFGGQATTVTPATATQIVVEAPANPTFGDVTGDGQVSAADALCILRAVVDLPSTGGCPAGGLDQHGLTTVVPVTVTNNDTPNLQLSTSTYAGTTTAVTFTYENFDVSGTDGDGNPKALDAQCLLFMAAGIQPGDPAYPSACAKPPINPIP